MQAYTELSFLALPAIETLVVFYVFTLIGVHLQSSAGAFRRLFFVLIFFIYFYPSHTFSRISLLELIYTLMIWTLLE